MSADVTKFAIEVAAGNHDRRHCPVSFTAGSAVPAGKSLKLTDVASGAAVPVSYCGCCCSESPVVTFILDELPKGSKREFLAELIDAPSCCGDGGEGVTLTHLPGDRVDIAIGGKPFTSYVIREGIARPYCYPVYGPAGVEMTNLGPSDHVHHRSMYIAQGEVNGHDNWSELAGHACTVNKSLAIVSQGAMGGLRATGDWVTSGGQPILEEQVCVCTYALPDGLRLIDWDITWSACYGGVFFGDTKEAGTLSVRVNEQLEGRRSGLITNAYGGVTESETWGKRAPWCDYSGQVDGHAVGLAIFDHPDNLRYPTYWHVRDYGLFTANQWGIHDFTGDWSQRGDYSLPKGQQLRFRFRVYIHEGNVTDARVADRYHDWATPPTVSLLV
jgi:hypothetical protein